MKIQNLNYKARCWGTSSHIQKWPIITDQRKSKLLKVTCHHRPVKEQAAKSDLTIQPAKEQAIESDLSIQIYERASC